MLGLALLVIAARISEPTAIATIRSGEPAGVYVSGLAFRVAAPIHRISKFLGASSDSTERFDLVPNAIRASRFKDSKLLWQKRCTDAVLRGDKIYTLYNNDLIAYRRDGHVHSRTRLTRSAIVWTYLDPNLRYAAGFRKKPYKENSWSLFLLEIQTRQVTQLPLAYDLGGLTDINIVSSEHVAVLYDDFRTYLLNGTLLSTPEWLRELDSYYTYDSVDAAGKLFLLRGELGAETSQVVEAQSGRVISHSSMPVRGFVKGKATQMTFYGFKDKQVTVYAPTVPLK